MSDEVLRRRLVGALVLLVGAFVLVSLLPSPGPAEPEDGVQVVTVDLDVPVSPPRPPDAEAVTPPTIEAPASPPAATPAPETVAVLSAPGAEAATEPLTPATVADPAPGPAAATPAPVEPPAPKPEPPRPEPAKPQPPAQKPAQKPEPAQAPAVKPADAARTWSIQVGAYSNIASARTAQDKLKAGGVDSIIAPAETEKGTLYRVRAGRYAGKEDAGMALPKIQALGFPDAAVKEN